MRKILENVIADSRDAFFHLAFATLDAAEFAVNIIWDEREAVLAILIIVLLGVFVS